MSVGLWLVLVLAVAVFLSFAARTINTSSRLPPHPDWPCKNPECPEPYCKHCREREAEANEAALRG